MIGVVTYCRVSSDEQAQKDISIPAQRKLLQRWVVERPEFEIVKEFADEGESAYAPVHRRPGFRQMIAFCRRSSVQHILVHKLDRFSRNQEESIIFKSLLRKHGVTVKSITEVFEPETPQGFLYEGMIEVINQFYSMNLATETLKGMRENAERGHVNGGRPPFGYRIARVANSSGREHSIYVPGPEDEVATVRELFDLAVNHGEGCRRLANRLNARGTRTSRGHRWTSNAVNRVLLNPVYVGDLVWFSSRRVGRDGRTATEDSERIVVPDAHEPLIDRDTFERRQTLAASRPFAKKKSKTLPVNWLLSRLIECDHCRSSFVGYRHSRTLKGGRVKEYRRYYCYGYLGKGKSVCASLPINADWLEGIVLDLIRARLCDADTLAELEGRIRERIESRRRTYGQDSRALAIKLQEIEAKVANYYRAIGEGLDPAVCRQHIDELTARKAELGREAAILGKEDYYERALDKNLAELHRFGTAFTEGFDALPFSVQRQVVLYFVDRIEVVERKLVRIHLKVPFDDNGIRLLTDEVETGETRRAGGENNEEAGSTDPLSNVNTRHRTGPCSGPDKLGTEIAGSRGFPTVSTPSLPGPPRPPSPSPVSSFTPLSSKGTFRVMCSSLRSFISICSTKCNTT